jgi:hypothetical protein
LSLFSAGHIREAVLRRARQAVRFSIAPYVTRDCA